VHPHDADGFSAEDEAWIRELAAAPEVVGIGECGLDYFRGTSDPSAQREAFVSQIGIARELSLPVVVHARAATEDTIATLGQHADGLDVVLHCFGMPERVEDVAEAGWYASFAGNVTFARADDLREAARAIPEDRLLLETDSPYLAPVPKRGKPNRPAWVVHTLERVAQVRGATAAALEQATDRNAARVFGW